MTASEEILEDILSELKNIRAALARGMAPAEGHAPSAPPPGPTPNFVQEPEPELPPSLIDPPLEEPRVVRRSGRLGLSPEKKSYRQAPAGRRV